MYLGKEYSLGSLGHSKPGVIIQSWLNGCCNDLLGTLYTYFTWIQGSPFGAQSQTIPA